MKVIAHLALVLILLIGCTNENKKVLRIWHTESDANAKKAFERIIGQFEKQHSNVKVEYEAISWDALSDKLTTALSTGDVPDIVHLQPFMVRSLQVKNLLEPIDDVITGIGISDIYSSVRNLQYFDGHYYGIAYAIGTTYFSYRKDWAAEHNLTEPTTWSAYISFVEKLQTDKQGKRVPNRFGTDLPGGSPFFIDQLFAEMVASNGGRLFDSTGRPTFTEKPVIETLQFLAGIAKNASPEWTNESYSDQFKTFAAGKVASVPVTYARASKQIESDARKEINNPDHFAVMEQPIGPSGTKSFATIDCEPWVVLKKSKLKTEAKEFLKTFYGKSNYLDFCLQVPIHLTPILKSVAESPEYLNNPFVKKWTPWQQKSLQMINENRVNPILLPEEDDRYLPFLLELQGSRILTDMIVSVAKSNIPAETAAQTAQGKAEKLISDLGYKKW